ncbi:hypothetical protein [Geminicoccus flavidas]|uniref:hypothetical protein n=1 Tax=Geminicoccus flavidas TaxID=2506407 RepID=UPI00135AAB40|nr:hypothetical protein [Geminicoccus flavidas]
MAMRLVMLMLMALAWPARAEPVAGFAADGWPILAALTEVSVATDNRIGGDCWAQEDAARTAVGEALSISGFRLVGQGEVGGDPELQAFLTIGAFGHVTETGNCIVVLELDAEHLLTYRIPGEESRLARSNLLVWHDSSVLSGPADGLSEVIMVEALGLAQGFALAVEAARNRAVAERPGPGLSSD